MTDFKVAYDAVKRLIESRYGIEVAVEDVLDPNTGDFDGARILIDYMNDAETSLFVLIHLFGHTVQWNTSEEFRKLGQESSMVKTPEELEKIYAYECDATRYSLTIMHEAGVRDMDAWVSEWFHADWTFLKHLYMTGEKLNVRSLLKPGDGVVLTPLEVPPFKPQHWVSRFAF